MKLKILTKFPSGRIIIREIEIEKFEWDDNHQFAYIPIEGAYSYHRWFRLEDYEEIVGLSL